MTNYDYYEIDDFSKKDDETLKEKRWSRAFWWCLVIELALLFFFFSLYEQVQ